MRSRKKAEKVLRTLKQQYFLLFLYNILGNNYQKSTLPFIHHCLASKTMMIYKNTNSEGSVWNDNTC
jgi:hypothetical protein